MILLKEAISTKDCFDMLQKGILTKLKEFLANAQYDEKARVGLTSKEVQHTRGRFDSYDWTTFKPTVLSAIKILINNRALPSSFWGKYAVKADRGELTGGGMAALSPYSQEIENYIALVDAALSQVRLNESRYLVELKGYYDQGNWFFRWEGGRVSIPQAAPESIAKLFQAGQVKDRATQPRSQRGKTYMEIVEGIRTGADCLSWIWSSDLPAFKDYAAKLGGVF